MKRTSIEFGAELKRRSSEGETVLEYMQEKGMNVKKQKFLRQGVSPIPKNGFYVLIVSDLRRVKPL